MLAIKNRTLMIVGIDKSNGQRTEGESANGVFRLTPVHYGRSEADDAADEGFISN